MGLEGLAELERLGEPGVEAELAELGVEVVTAAEAVTAGAVLRAQAASPARGARVALAAHLGPAERLASPGSQASPANRAARAETGCGTSTTRVVAPASDDGGNAYASVLADATGGTGPGGARSNGSIGTIGTT